MPRKCSTWQNHAIPSLPPARRAAGSTATANVWGRREWMETLLCLLGHGHHRCCRLRCAAGAFGIRSRLAPALALSWKLRPAQPREAGVAPAGCRGRGSAACALGCAAPGCSGRQASLGAAQWRCAGQGPELLAQEAVIDQDGPMDLARGSQSPTGGVPRQQLQHPCSW